MTNETIKTYEFVNNIGLLNTHTMTILYYMTCQNILKLCGGRKQQQNFNTERQ